MTTFKNFSIIFGTFVVLLLIYLVVKSMLGYDRSRTNPKINKVETEFGTHEFVIDTAYTGTEKKIPMH